MTIEEIIEQLDGIVGTYEILIGNGVNSDILDVDDIEAIREAISALSAEPFREADDYENEIADLHNRLDIAEYDKERYKEEITTLEAKNKGEWIPASNPPKESGRYLAYIVNEYDEKLQYQMTADYIARPRPIEGLSPWAVDDECASDNVVAWMPLPGPYKAESIDPNDLTHMFDGVTEIPKDAFKGWTTEKLLEQIRKENNDNPEDTGCDHND